MSAQNYFGESYLDMNRIRREGRTQHDNNAGALVLGRLIHLENHLRAQHGEPTGMVVASGHELRGWQTLVGNDGGIKEEVGLYVSHFHSLHRFVVDHSLDSFITMQRLHEGDTKTLPWHATRNKRYELVYYPVGTLEDFAAYEHPRSPEPVEPDFVDLDTQFNTGDITDLHMVYDALTRAAPIWPSTKS